MGTVILLGVVFGIIYFAFSSSFSPIPFFPTNGKDLPKIIDTLKLKNDQIVFDLGAGTGTVIFAAATEAHKKGLNTKFIAIDINFVLSTVMHIRRMFHPNAAHIEIKSEDLFKFKYTDAVKSFKHLTFYMYVSPWYTDPMTQTIIDIKKSAHIVSYFYPIKMLKAVAHHKGENGIFVYRV